MKERIETDHGHVEMDLNLTTIVLLLNGMKWKINIEWEAQVLDQHVMQIVEVIL